MGLFSQFCVWTLESFRYVNTSSGDVAEFHGEEQISRAGVKVCGLRYQGGIVR